ncbi:Regulatory protein leu3 [Elasticomyces elasticus]|nr:Regulatory protein leu3 [Elasticomyces elasticus]KAK5025745.1 Regulatory protein leu3 [Exophiala sideris]KAK5180636.1 Regulatory protein leu3 [Eurotiomycetes sp. CCFEE 6388]
MRLDCTVDPSYRRANRYDKVRDLQRQLELLQSTGEYQQCDTPPAPTVPVPPRSQPTHQSDEHEPDGQVTTAPVDVVSTVAAVVAEDRSTILPITSTQQGFTLETDLVKPTAGDDHATSTRTAAEASDCSSSNGMNSSVCVLGVIRLPRVQAKAMFATYFEKYHPFLPILDSQRTNESCYETSPLLFWSIIGVAARQLQLEDNFLKQLGSELSQALWTTVASNTPSTQHVQAMLLLASWPLPDVRLWTDKSLTFTKMAMNLAMMMGMHRPGCEHEYSKDSAQASNNWDTLERSRTWIAAAALCQSFEALRSLTQAADGPYGIPAGLNCFDLIDRCEQQFRDLESSLNDQLSLANRLELQGSKLHIQCFYFLYDDRVELRLPGILRAYATASTLISTILSDDSSHDVLPHAPLRFTRIILNAALVIFRILHSTFAFGLDHSHGKLLFNAAAFAMQQQSVPQKDRDFPLRGSDMLRAFWRAGERSTTMFNQDLKLRVKSRMGASLVYDCLLLFRQKDRSANLSQDSTTNGAQTSPHDLNLTVAPSENVYTQPMHVPNSAPSVSGSIFSEGLLHISPNIDMSNMFWLEDMGYPGFFDIG